MVPHRRFDPSSSHTTNIKCNMYTTNLEIATDYADWMTYNLDLGVFFENFIQDITDARADLAVSIGCAPDDIELPRFSMRIYRFIRDNADVFNREATRKWAGRSLNDYDMREAARVIWCRLKDVISSKASDIE